MDKNMFAPTPPMGWNSYDYYDTTVTEEDIKKNADFMATYMKAYGWEYVVVDIEWYAYHTGSLRDQYQYIPFEQIEMDEYSRLYPCPDRFPSSVSGAGFKPLADYIHNLGLKFGIHIMRGIPRIAAHNHTKIKGTSVTANQVADPSSICSWNPDMYGIVPNRPGSQEYYDSLFELYASWGVDFVKCDDICRMDATSAKEEIIMLQKAIQSCNRPIVLSLSPGPAKVEEAWHYETYANMWRITDDFWDNWSLLLNMFERCEHWQNHVSTGCYPDCDMIPVGYLGKGFGEERQTNFTKEEQMTMISLWSIFRSPMMLGAELTKLDPWTLALLTNKDVLHLLTNSQHARQLVRDQQKVVWTSQDLNGTTSYLAVFNLEEARELTIEFNWLPAYIHSTSKITELWTQETKEYKDFSLQVSIPAHGVKLYRIESA
ncbi:glycoside hydrolase family 27 protein [Anaerosporobacter faecicola]|uniref:glycoside hydrolase family 27 protein n=1 Tax=Anaerosporobacter faecicola TaxID=2718714 RepID=UPI0014398821|nr:glycoside hydrolase family 27 protein [Anaerosporobacter faecicola]